LIFFQNFFFSEEIFAERQCSVAACFVFIWYKSIPEFIASIISWLTRTTYYKAGKCDQE